MFGCRGARDRVQTVRSGEPQCLSTQTVYRTRSETALTLMSQGRVPAPQKGEGMALEGYTLARIADFVGQELGVSDWVAVDQQRIDAFADCTGDHQWIHVDVERAKRESPFGGTIAHGYLVLSLLPMMQFQVGTLPEGVTAGLNYGAD